MRFILVLCNSSLYRFHNFFTHSLDGECLGCFKFLFPLLQFMVQSQLFLCASVFLILKIKSKHLPCLYHCIPYNDIFRAFPSLQNIFKLIIASHRWRPDSPWGFLGPQTSLITVPFAVKALYELQRLSPICNGIIIAKKYLLQ